MTLTWTVELHSHTVYSDDSLTRLDDLQRICAERGLDKLAVTDHNTAKGALEMARAYPMLVIPGEEVMTSKGELLAWYVTEGVPPGLSPEETIRRFRDQGALVCVPHPFDRNRAGSWDEDELTEIIDLIDAVEVFNARCVTQRANRKALEFAEEHGKLMVCGSDAHTRGEYGRSVMVVPPFAGNSQGLSGALAQGTRVENPSPGFVHVGSTYAKWAKRLFHRLRVD